MSFNHRITGVETEEFQMESLSVLGLSKSIDGMTDRASSTLSLLLPYFNDTEQDNRPDDRTIYFVLNSLKLDLVDIQKTVEAYAQVNKRTEQA